MDAEQILAALHAALAPDATPELRAAGAAAARTMLAQLEPSALQSPPVAPSPQAPANVQAIARMLAALRGAPPEQLLDLAIQKLRAALPAGATVPAIKPLAFQLVPIPPRS